MITATDQAFPGTTDKGFKSGISVLAHFASQAPVEIPTWFKHEFIEQPARRPSLDQMFGEASSHEYKEYYMKYFDIDVEGYWKPNDNIVPKQLMDEVKEHIMELRKDTEEKNKWDYENEVARYFQWRVFYGQQLINALNTKK